MKLPAFIIAPLRRWAERIEDSRQPDFVIGERSNPYLLRWWIIPRNRFLNVYLHEVLRSDDDRALHDHPWLNCSIILAGSYVEHTISAGGINSRIERTAGEIKLRRAVAAHRLEIPEGGAAMTLFITGPKLRKWGFHCPSLWRPWDEFCRKADGTLDPSLPGRGCD